MRFSDPWLLLLIPLVFLIFHLAGKKSSDPGIRFSSGELLKGFSDSFRLKFYRNIVYLRIAAVVMGLLALARPQMVYEESKTLSEGIDIVLAVDISTSMLAMDFGTAEEKRNRIESAKNVIREFARARSNDRIAMVAFAARPYTVCPLTLDHEWLVQNLTRVEAGMIEDGTAIGAGLFAAMNRLREPGNRAKIIILLTDGRNNAGEVPPLAATEAARALGIKVYVIGVGSSAPAMYPVQDPFGKTIYKTADVDLDEEILGEIAAKTKARYFRASDAGALRAVYNEIDLLEKRAVEVKRYYHYQDIFHLCLFGSLVLLLAEVLMKNTVLRRLP